LRIAAHTLTAAAPLASLSAALIVVATAAVAIAMLIPVVVRTTSTACLVVVLALGALAQWLALRVRLDAALLRDLADARERGVNPWPAFDRAMVDLALLPSGKAGRDELARCRGALRLAQVLGYTVAAQLALFAVVLGDLFLHRTW
jgi:hypothetical protein